MNNSIHQFSEEGVKKLSKVFESYTEDLTKIAEMVQGVTDEVVNLGVSIIAEEWESYDELLRGSLTPKILETQYRVIFLHKFQNLVYRNAVLCYNRTIY